MAFDLSSATPVDFDLSSAVPDTPVKKKKEEKEYGFFGNVLGGIAEPIAAMASGAIAKPVSEVMGLAAMGREMLPGAIGGDPRAFQQEMQQNLTYEPKTPAGRSMANPLNLIPYAIGQGVQALGKGAGELVAPEGSEPGRTAVGRGVTEAVEQAPQFLGLKAPAAGAAAKTALQGEGYGARGMMQRAVKPPVGALPKETAAAITTMLDEGLFVSKGGVEKLQGKIHVLNDQIKDAIRSSTEKINKAEVAQSLGDALDRFRKQVTPQSDMATVQRAWTQFMEHPDLPKVVPARTVESAILDERGRPFTQQIPASGTNEFPVQLAQELKQGTYRQLGDKPYGELKGAEIESQKTLARGLKEKIVEKVPEVGPLNTAESRLLNAMQFIEPRVRQEGNKNPVGLGMLHPSSIPAWMFDRSSLAKSMLAQLLNKTGNAAPAVGAAGPYAGLAMNPGAQEEMRRRFIAEMLNEGQ